MTLAESFLWQNLRANALDHKFLRQHVIGDYIVDFVCLKYADGFGAIHRDDDVYCNWR